jgi:hypothetical protein
MVVWSSISSIDDLKKIGSLQEVKQEFSTELQTRITARSWKQLLEKIKIFQKVFNSSLLQVAADSELDLGTSHLLYFRSETDRAIFALVEADGRYRKKLLGVTSEHYGDLELAKQWRRDLAKLVHPDKTKHPYSEEAMSNLEQMYEEMVTR